MNILVTSGATREYIDGVRFITNFSTGKTGAALADYFARRGHRVFYLHGESAALPHGGGIAKAEFSGFSGLDARLRLLLKRRRFAMIVHCAAVSDYSVNRVISGGRAARPGTTGKLDSSRPLRLELKPNFKILDRLPAYAGNKPLIIGFKLTNTKNKTARLAAVRKITAPITVHNDLNDIKAGRRIFRVYAPGGRVSYCTGSGALARLLLAAGEKHAARS